MNHTGNHAPSLGTKAVMVCEFGYIALLSLPENKNSSQRMKALPMDNLAIAN
jgi:hypothetical protein